MYWLPGLLLLLLLHWKQGVGSPLPSTSKMDNCTISHACSNNIMTQIKNQLNELNATADALLRYYYEAQGDPFASIGDKFCNYGLNNVPAFHNKSAEKDKLTELYFISKYFENSLDDILQYEKTVNPSAKDFINHLSPTVDTIWGLISNVLCHLCTHYNVGHMDIPPSPDTSGKDTFQVKTLGCQLLVKYKQVIAELDNAF